MGNETFVRHWSEGNGRVTHWRTLWRSQAATGQPVRHKPRLLNDNGSSYISGDLAKWLGEQGMDHVRGAPNHPQTQGKIEPSRQIATQSPAGNGWHQTLKTRIRVSLPTATPNIPFIAHMLTNFAARAP